MERLDNDEICAACDHRFAQHWATYAGDEHGCAGWRGQRDSGEPCTCRGFARRYRPTGTPASGRKSVAIDARVRMSGAHARIEDDREQAERARAERYQRSWDR